MAGTNRILVPAAAPPIVVPPIAGRRSGQDNPLPRLGRLVWLVAALSLPALGLTVADLVHRGGEPGATQAAAPTTPSGGAAAPTGAIPAFRVGMASPALGLPRNGRA